MPTTLTINGTAYTQGGRRASNYLINGWGWDVDAGFWLEFSEHTAGPQPTIAGPRPVSLDMGAGTLFSGDIVSVCPAIDGAGRRTWGYRCLGLEYRAAWIPVTAADGSGLIRFNVNPSEQDYYVPSFAGQSVGQILSYCLSQHASALTAAGITTDATTSSSLAALTLVPNQEVQVAGERLWPALQGVLQRWARNMRLIITGAGLVRLVDVTAGAAHTLTLGTDPIDPPLFSRNWTTAATRFTVRGQGIIEPGYVSYLKGTLTKAWSGANESAWTYSAFTNPTGASTDKGTVTAVTSATTITVQSSNAARTWATNYWPGLQAWIYLTKTTGTGLTYQEARPVTACGSLSAGGTCSITLGYALNNSGASDYDGYQLIGTNVPLASGGLYDVWRLYNVADPGSLIKNHLVTSFPTQVPFVGVNGQSAALTNAPMCEVIGATTAASAPFTVLPATGQILFTRPVVEVLNSTSALNSGSYATPTDIYVLLAYSRGALTTTYPPDAGGPVYSGTAYTAAGLQRTAYQDMYDWRYGGNTSVLNSLAQMLQVSVRNTLVEGTVHYKGLYTACQDPSGGHLLSIAGNGYTTGDESLNIPVRSYSVRYHTEGGGLNYSTSLRCSTRQDPRTGEGFYDHLSVLGSGAQWGGGGVVAAGAPTFAGTTGWGFGTGGGADWDMGQEEGPRRRRRGPRLGSASDRWQAAEAHDLADRQARGATDARESEGSMSGDERENLARSVDSDNRRRREALSRTDEGAQRRAGEEATAKREEQGNRERVVRSDNARRARRLESPEDRSYRIAGEASSGGAKTAAIRNGPADDYLNGPRPDGPPAAPGSMADRYLNGGGGDAPANNPAADEYLNGPRGDDGKLASSGPADDYLNGG